MGGNTEERTLIESFQILRKHRYLIILIVSIAVAVAAAVSFFLPKVYEARAVIQPVKKRDQGMGNMRAVAAQFGIPTQESSNESEIVNLLRSNILREKTIKKYDLLPMFFDREDLEGMDENERTWEGIRHLEGALRITPSRRDDAIVLSMRDEDPETAAKVLNFALAELIEHMSSESRRVAETNRRYLESLIDKTTDPFIKANIYTLIAEQIEVAMMAEVKENFAFKVIDPPRVPDRAVRPRKTANIAFSFVASSFLGIVAAFFKEYIDKTRADTGGLECEQER
jgi:uncharacterized protein involved in exopolysaccharide biosynthesis